MSSKGDASFSGRPMSLADAEILDAQDPLAFARKRFQLPDGVIYLDGHSLGPPPTEALARVRQTAEEEWGQGLIRSWNSAGWFDLPHKVAAKLARLIGVNADDVVVGDSVSVNLFKLAAAALPLARSRELVVESGEFPTDQYIAEGLAVLVGARFRRVAPGDSETALACGGVYVKSLVNYRTADVTEVAGWEAAARASGAIIVWDLSHASGVLDLRLAEQGARIAAGCTYKYLNGGPGGPAYLWVRRDVAEQIRTPIPGWFGHDAPFSFESAYRPRSGTARFAAGTPPILSLSALDAALDAFDGVSPADLQRKAHALAAIWIDRANGAGLPAFGARSLSQRGAHVSLQHPEGYAIVQALIDRGVIGDFRAPDAMRFGFSPLFLRHADVWRAFDHLEEVLKTEAWRGPAYQNRSAVT